VVDIVNRRCGHNYENGTTDVNFLYFIYAISRIIASKRKQGEDKIRKHEALKTQNMQTSH